MKLKDLIVLFGHCMEAWLGKLVIIVVVADRGAVYVFREGPEAIQLHILTQFHSSADNHKSRRQTVGFDPFSPPVLGEMFEVSGIEEDGLLPGMKFSQDVVNFERSSSVAPERKGWQQKESISVDGNVFQESELLFIQLIVSVNMQRLLKFSVGTKTLDVQMYTIMMQQCYYLVMKAPRRFQLLMHCSYLIGF